MLALISGWTAVAATALFLSALTVAACRIAIRGLGSTLAVTALSFPAMWLLARHVFGDASVYFPQNTFSNGAHGKVIVVSILCTVLGGIMVAAVIVGILRRLDRVLNRPRTGDNSSR